MLSISQTQGCNLEQYIRVVGTHRAILCSLLHELREDLTESSSEGNDVLLTQLDDSEETSYRIQVLVRIKELTNILQQLGDHILTKVGFIEDWLSRINQGLANKKLLNACGSV